jgi:hypothetical protein
MPVGDVMAGVGFGFERFDLVTPQAQMLNLARTAPRRPHDLHSDRPEAVFTVRT